MANVSSEQLLFEIEDIIRSMPDRSTLNRETPENLDWFARAAAAIYLWDSARALMFNQHVAGAQHSFPGNAAAGIRGVQTMLRQAAHELRLRTAGPLTVAVGQGAVFDFYDEVRKVIESATNDLFFIDRYLNADFISRYIPYVRQGTTVRLLARDTIASLVPAAQMMAQQRSLQIQVRASNDFHDRYVFTDGSACYQSGASFKDGGKHPTTFTQLIDAVPMLLATYEQKWSAATVHL